MLWFVNYLHLFLYADLVSACISYMSSGRSWWPCTDSEAVPPTELVSRWGDSTRHTGPLRSTRLCTTMAATDTEQTGHCTMSVSVSLQHHIDGLVQDCGISSWLGIWLPQSCTELQITTCVQWCKTNGIPFRVTGSLYGEVGGLVDPWWRH